MQSEYSEWLDEIIGDHKMNPIEPIKQSDPINEDRGLDGWQLISKEDIGDSKIKYTWDTGARIVIKIRQNGKLIRMQTDDTPDTYVLGVNDNYVKIEPVDPLKPATNDDDKLITFWRD